MDILFDSLGISGLPGSGKTTLINVLKQELGWESVSVGGLIRERYNSLISSDELLKEVSFEKYYSGFYTEGELLLVNDEARKRIIQGQVILDSRFLHVNCRGLAVPQFFLTADIDVRARRRALQIGKLTEESVKVQREILLTRENDEKTRCANSYGSLDGGYDYTDPKWYWKVIDTGKHTIEQETEIILSYMR